MQTHTRENISPCDVHGSAFSNHYDLKRHMRTHTGRKPFSCEVCGSAFSGNSNLINHTRKHTLEGKKILLQVDELFLPFLI